MAALIGGGADKCVKCTKSVYKNDPQVNIDGKVFHKFCAKCTQCDGQVKSKSFSSLSSFFTILI